MRTPLGIVSEKKKALKMKFKEKQAEKPQGEKKTIEFKKFANFGMSPFEFSNPKQEAEIEKPEL